MKDWIREHLPTMQKETSRSAAQLWAALRALNWASEILYWPCAPHTCSAREQPGCGCGGHAGAGAGAGTVAGAKAGCAAGSTALKAAYGFTAGAGGTEQPGGAELVQPSWQAPALMASKRPISSR